MKIKKLLIGLGLALALAGCANGEETKTEAPLESTGSQVEDTEETLDETESEGTEKSDSDLVEFTDSLGRTVEVPAEITRLAPSGHMATMITYSIDPDMIVAVSSRPSEESARFFSQDYMNLPEVGAFYGKKADLNLEALLAADPQILIDAGEIKGSVEDMSKDLDELSEKVGLPVVFIETELDNMKEAYESFGTLLDREEKTKILGDYCEEVVKMAEEKSVQLEEADKKTFFISAFDTGLGTSPAGSIQAEVVERIGGINVVDSSFDSKSDVSFEQLLGWDPDIILFEDNTVYGEAETDPNWSMLRAVQEDSYYRIPDEPYNFIARPPATNRIMGIIWAGNLFYPDLYDYDIVEKTQEFYDLFYGYDLSEEEALGLLIGSSVKAGRTEGPVQ